MSDAQLAMLPEVEGWTRVNKFDPRSAALADRHYSRRKIGSPQFMPPGQTVILYRPGAVFGWWRPDPASGIRAMNGLDGWTCTIFRNETRWLASVLIVEAERELVEAAGGCGPDGLLSYVWSAKVRSKNPGCCFKKAGWRPHPVKPRSADGRKLLFCKPWWAAGLSLDLMRALACVVALRLLSTPDAPASNRSKGEE